MRYFAINVELIYLLKIFLIILKLNLAYKKRWVNSVMMQTRAIRKLSKIQWKKKDNIAILLIIFVGSVLTFVGSFYNEFYNLFFSTCVGLFFGGIILSIISTFLAQMESNITGAGELDAEIDVDIDADVDVDADIDVDVDADIDVDVDADIDVDIDADIDVDIDADIDVDIDIDTDIDVEVDVDSDIDVDIEAEVEIDTDFIATITPAPIMLLFSSGFLIFGISGILLYQLIEGILQFSILFIAPLLAYLSTKLINFAWKIIAKSRFYRISSTKNLIGIQGEVLLRVDERGGIIKIPSNTPMRFERLHVKPIVDTFNFERGDKVYICDVRNGYLLVDNKKKSIKKRRG